MRIELERDGDHCMICCADGRKRRVDCVPMDALYIGLKLKVFQSRHVIVYSDGVRGACKYCGQKCDGLPHGPCLGKTCPIELATRLSVAVHQIDDVLNSSEKHIAKARGQIEDAGGITEGLSDLDIAIMDVYVREWLAEQAREVEDPFNAHESGVWPPTRTIRLEAPDLPYLFDGYVGEAREVEDPFNAHESAYGRLRLAESD